MVQVKGVRFHRQASPTPTSLRFAIKPALAGRRQVPGAVINLNRSSANNDSPAGRRADEVVDKWPLRSRRDIEEKS